MNKPGKIPKQCAYFASPGGCVRGEKCLYLHEMEAGKPKPALPEDVAKKIVGISVFVQNDSGIFKCHHYGKGRVECEA